ncbi:hypothetical protein Desdi_2907 [Desulfitobacterium dichloroeliminans LMG P-21439]|uniref:Uncharacterized protein n=1 Tax=Desulfitobacterium dichloroeliminans (strain LMG P-21439 / DCA1) TaxID=871963 RepID=L0F910_DESDL|nr:DUF6470 family protein [Desulfitobacterium dichloroeliminans]AGA70319.1 hypothetical protein Desdi_2907 [Desulfitobacterium dichloroeliminans LMG P-21439]
MLQLNITSQPIRLEYTIQNAQLNQKTTHPILEMERIPPRLEISQPKGKLTIDSTEFYHSIGLKTREALSKECAERGRQATLDAIAATIVEGNRLAQITNPSNAFADLAFESRFSKKGELSWEPIIAPSVRYEAIPPQIEVIEGKVNYNLVRGSVDGEYVPGKVSFQVAQYPRVDISTIDVKA